jgi:hypothetical protein
MHSAKGLQIRRSLRRQKNESNIQRQKGPTKVKIEAIDTKKLLRKYLKVPRVHGSLNPGLGDP